MPKSNLDWLSVASLWLAAGIMAVKAGDLPLVSGAPRWFAANFWGYVPFALVSFYGAVSLFRLQRSENSIRVESPILPQVGSAPQTEANILNPDVLPDQISKDFLDLMASDHTQIQEQKLLKPFVGKWIKLTAVMVGISKNRKSLRVMFYPYTRGKGSIILVNFGEEWEDHLSHTKPGQRVEFKAKIIATSEDTPTLEHGELL